MVRKSGIAGDTSGESTWDVRPGLVWARRPATDRLADRMDSVEKNAGDDFGTDVALPCSEGKGRRLLDGTGEAANGHRAGAGRRRAGIWAGNRHGIRGGSSEAANALRGCHFRSNMPLSCLYVAISLPPDPRSHRPPRVVTLSRYYRTMFRHSLHCRLDRGPCENELQQGCVTARNVHTQETALLSLHPFSGIMDLPQKGFFGDRKRGSGVLYVMASTQKGTITTKKIILSRYVKQQLIHVSPFRICFSSPLRYGKIKSLDRSESRAQL